MQSKRGGARIGAGRKPKALRYEGVAQRAEETIVEALPEIVDKLVSMAKAGDVAAARYVVDRILGRVAVLEAAPVEDRKLPYNELDFEEARDKRAKSRYVFSREMADWNRQVEERWGSWRMPESTSTSGETLDDLKRAVEEDERRRGRG